MAIRAKLLQDTNSGVAKGRQLYDVVQSQLGAAGSDVVLVQSVSNQSTTSGGVTTLTVTLSGVTAGNTLVLAYSCYETALGTLGISFSDSQSQTVTVLYSQDSVSGASAECGVAWITNALAGAHTVTVSTLETCSYSLTLYELSGVKKHAGAGTYSAFQASLSLPTDLNQVKNSIAIAAAMIGQTSESMSWYATSAQLTQDAYDTGNLQTETGHYFNSGGTVSQPCEMFRTGTGGNNYLAGALFY